MKKSPNIFEYLHVMQYLKDYFESRKKNDARFSYDFWAKELGFKSKSYLRMILIGKKKVSPVFEAAFAKATEMSEKEAEYFHFLILHSQAAKQTDRQLYGKKLIHLIQSSAEQMEVEKYYEFLEDPALPVLQTLLSFQDITPSVARLSVLMNLSVSETQLALDKLVRLQLAEEYELDGERYWRSKNKYFKVPGLIGDIALENFHRNTLKQAQQALTLPKKLKNFRCLLLPLNPEELDELYKLVDEFAATLTAKFRSDEYQGRRIFKLNVINFPALDSSEESESEI